LLKHSDKIEEKMLTELMESANHSQWGVIEMKLNFISIYEVKKGRFAIAIPARYSINEQRAFIYTDKNGIAYDSHNYAMRDAFKIDDDIAYRSKVDPTLYTSKKPKKFIMRHFVETWLESKVGIAEASIQQYRYTLKFILEHLGDRDLRFFTKYDGVQFKQLLQGESSTKNKHIVMLNDILRCANEWHDLNISLLKKVKQVKKRKVAVTEELRTTLLNRIDPHHRKIFRFIFYTGCRSCEAIALRYPFINWEHKTAYINEHLSGGKIVGGTKEGEEKEIGLDWIEDLTPMLKEMYDETFDKMGLVFLNKNGNRYGLDILHLEYRKATKGITDLTLHHIARSTTMNKIIDEHGLGVGMTQAGWHDINTANRYKQVYKMRHIKR